MLVANSFDLWQKDSFFKAAEEVQNSADIMESAYRIWLRERREGVAPQYLDEFCRELQTALGTAKWQLEEFERAVRLSYRSRADDITATRHRQFVAAIEDQISRVETALKESFSEGGKQPLRWVSLDEEECDDLALFLSGTRRTSQECVNLKASTESSLGEKQHAEKYLDLNLKASSNREIPYQADGFKDVVTNKINANCAIEIEAKEISGTRDNINCQTDRKIGSRRTWSSPDIGDLKIVIDDEDEQSRALMLSIEPTPKEKGSKPFFWKPKLGDHPQKGGILSYSKLKGINWINQLLGLVGGSQRQLQTPLHLQFSCSIQVKLALMLTILLIVPYVLYSTLEKGVVYWSEAR